MKNPVASPEGPAAFDTTIEGTWFVKARAGILSMTLDQLDEAYQRGEVEASTSVFTAGMAGWDTLGNVANLAGPAAADDGVERLDPLGDETSEITLEPIDGSSFPPTTTGVFGTGGLPWASIVSPDTGAHTVVRRSAGFIPYPVRKAAGKVADFAASVRLSQPRLAVAGPWLFGAALSGIFVFSLYRLGSAAARPSAATTSSSVTARSTASGERPAATRGAAQPSAVQPSAVQPSTARPSGAQPSIAQPSAGSALASAAAPLEPERAAPPPSGSESEDGSVTTLRPNDLRFAKPTRSDGPLARSARPKAKGAKASASKKAKSRAHRKLAKRSVKRRSTELD